MTLAELRLVADEIAGARGPRRIGGALRRVAGWARPRDRAPASPGGGKLRALWISGWHLGVVRDRTDAALAAWVRRQTGLDAAAWAAPVETARAIEALRAWLARAAGVDWRPKIVLDRGGREREVDHPRARVLEAQWRILAGLGVVRVDSPSALAATPGSAARTPTPRSRTSRPTP